MAISDNIKIINDKIAAACNRAKRSPDSVRLLAVTKTHSADFIRPAYDFGLRCFGENRVLELRDKKPLLPNDISWHLIGHLQHNKAKAAVEIADWIHSVDSIELLTRINRFAADTGKKPNLLLEVNISGEESKFGLTPDAVEAVLEGGRDGQCPIVGLMTMAPFEAPEKDLHRIFGNLRELRNDMERKTGLPLPELSMGMSGDFEIAIEEGATIVRVGSAIFGARG